MEVEVFVRQRGGDNGLAGEAEGGGWKGGSADGEEEKEGSETDAGLSGH